MFLIRRLKTKKLEMFLMPSGRAFQFWLFLFFYLFIFFLLLMIIKTVQSISQSQIGTKADMVIFQLGSEG